MRKLNYKLDHETIVKVTCADFPIDMLRYDSCFPREEGDSHKIIDSMNPVGPNAQYEIYVKKYTSKGFNPAAVWSVDRWRAYGCALELVA